MRQKLEDEKRALQIFVADIERIQFSSRSQLPRPSIGAAAFAEARRRSNTVAGSLSDSTNSPSPLKLDTGKFKSNLLGERLEEIDEMVESSPVISRVLGDKENIAF